MRSLLYKTGKFYTRMIISNIGIFIFVGLLSVLFGSYGWFPDKNMYAISQLAYRFILPVLISYEGGRQIGGQNAGVLAVLAVSGILAADLENGLWGAMVMGPAAGFLWKHVYGRVSGAVKAGLQMLFRNLSLAVMGACLGAAGFFCLAPLLEIFGTGLGACVEFLVQHGLTGVISIITEPAKVFFLNNLMNHGIFIPIGMEQAADTGRSLFFLLEANPGPGMGLLLAFICCNKERRSEYGAALFTQAAGGLHEVYFPYVLSDLRLLLPLTAGGLAGNIVFRLTGAGLFGAVSPGSVVTIFLMAGKGEILPVSAGILASAAVAFAGSILVLKGRRMLPVDERKQGVDCEMEKAVKESFENIKRIAVVCDGGVGTSAMGAALLRRRLAQEKIDGIKTEAWAADLVPEDADLIVCQKDFGEHIPEKLKSRNIFMADSLLNAEAYGELARKLQEGIR
ncbi:MAG: hypothetical protein Q4D16_11435 [Eubacteriales bacterium]|nr:hypothetical protein [Eubacteriales bacterium]